MSRRGFPEYRGSGVAEKVPVWPGSGSDGADCGESGGTAFAHGHVNSVSHAGRSRGRRWGKEGMARSKSTLFPTVPHKRHRSGVCSFGLRTGSCYREMDKSFKAVRHMARRSRESCPFFRRNSRTCSASNQPIFVPLQETMDKYCAPEGGFHRCHLYIIRQRKATGPPGEQEEDSGNDRRGDVGAATGTGLAKPEK